MKTSGLSNPVATAVILVLLAASVGLYLLQIIGVPILTVLVILSLLTGASIKIADQWGKAVVLRMGRFHGLKGPGLFFIVPVIDQINSFIDQRVRVTEFRAGQTITKGHPLFLIAPASHELPGFSKC